jgi:hypothetical protein
MNESDNGSVDRAVPRLTSHASCSNERSRDEKFRDERRKVGGRTRCKGECQNLGVAMTPLLIGMTGCDSLGDQFFRRGTFETSLKRHFFLRIARRCNRSFEMRSRCVACTSFVIREGRQDFSVHHSNKCSEQPQPRIQKLGLDTFDVRKSKSCESQVSPGTMNTPTEQGVSAGDGDGR